MLNTQNIYGRETIAEKFLLGQLNPNQVNSYVMNAVYHIINRNGNMDVAELSDYCCISRRQLERVFSEYLGVPPKQMISLIRYQLLWQESLKIRFDVFDAVSKFGFYDQPHFLRGLKNYHGVTMTEAKSIALNE